MSKKSKDDENLELKDFELVSHGFKNEDGFWDEEINLNGFEKIITGQGANELEAFNDTLEQLKETLSFEFNLNKVIKEAGDLKEDYYDAPLQYDFDEDNDSGFESQEIPEDVYYFYSIRYNLPTP